MAESSNEIPTCFCCLQLLERPRQDIIEIDIEGCNHKYCAECILNFMDLQMDDLLKEEILTHKGKINENNKAALKYREKYSSRFYYCLQCENHFDASDLKAYTHKKHSLEKKKKKQELKEEM